MLTERTFRPFEPDQLLLLPPSLKEWLPSNHLANFILDLLPKLNLKEILSGYGGPTRGTQPYDPRMMVGLLLYAYCAGTASSRKMAGRCVEDVAFRVLTGNQQPDFRTISDFRKAHLESLRKLFIQVLRLCQKAGLVKMGHVAIDGTKMKANASKHKAMSYDRMEKEEERLKAEVDRMFREAERIDEEEDRLYGKDKRGDELPEELAFRAGRLKKIQEAMEELEREAKEEAERKRKENKGQQAQRGRPTKPLSGIPDPKAQKNFTDPESRIMPSSENKGSFVQGYNCQAAVENKKQIIVAEDVTQQTNDKQQAAPMLAQVKANTGKHPDQASMDAGYFSEENVNKIEAKEIEPLIPPDRQEHGKDRPEAPRGTIPKDLSVADRMRRKLRTKRGREDYSKRKETVEPVFGQIKQGRGFRQFLLRGLQKVKGEWSLICTTHNLLKLWRAGGMSLIKPPGRSWAAG
jgi:transposase